MKGLDVLTVAIAGTALVSAIELAPRSPNPRVVGFDIQRRSISGNFAQRVRRRSELFKRSGTVEESLLNYNQSLYLANFSLGTPPQQVQLALDTGSSDLWVNEPNSTICSGGDVPCVGGTYDSSKSSTFKYVNSDFNISYGDGSGAIGIYATDTLQFAGNSLNHFQFGIGENVNANQDTQSQGVAGIGYITLESESVFSGGQTYPNLPQALLSAGAINRLAYSLWLNDLDASTGQILFGGVDSAKYQGNLETVPILKIKGGYYYFLIALTSIGFNGSSITSSNLPSPVLLDSGSTVCMLPDDIVMTIYDQLDIAYDQDQGIGYGYCSLATHNSYLQFGFSGMNIQVPFSELFLPAGTDESGQPYTFSNGEDACIFGIAPALGGLPILGDTFLRSAYVVYDLELNEISLAQTKFNVTTEDVVAIASGSGAIPGATPAPSPVSSVAIGTATDGAVLGNPTGSYTLGSITPTGTGAAASSATAGSSSKSHNGAYPTKAPYLAGAALAVGAGLLL